MVLNTVLNDEAASLSGGQIQTGAAERPSSAAIRILRNLSPRMVADAAMAIDVAVIILSSVLSHLGYNVLAHGEEPDLLRYGGVGLVAALAAAISFARSKSYEFDNLIDLAGQIGRVLSAWLGGILVLVALAFVLKISKDFSRGWAVIWFALTPFTLLAGRTLIASLLTTWTRRGYLRRNVAIVGVGPLAERLCSYIESRGPRMGLRIVGLFDDRRTRVRETLAKLPVLGTVDDLLAYARSYKLDEVIIALPWSAETRVASLVEELSALPADIRLCPDLVGLRFLNRPYSRIGEIGLLHVNQRPIAEWSLIVKTIQDYVVAMVALTIGAPFMAMIALAIKLDSPGPILFKQRRRGFNQNMVSVWKFRTMHVLEDDQTLRQAHKNDARITRVGRFLRRASLDELPQFINVLQGSMSVVGPRPHALAHDDYYARLIGRYARRNRVKPGLTGWAQIHGFRGETQTVDKMVKRVEYDLYYIENWSLWLDFKIILLTVFKGLWHENAY